MDILEQVGITKDELIDRIVEKALGITADYKQTGEESWEDIPLSSVVDRKITEAIGNLVDTMKKTIQTRIDEIMTREVEKVFTLPFQPVTRWGEKNGEETTIRDLIAKEADEYWKKVVNKNGEPITGYSLDSGSIRAEHYARKVMTEYYNKELVETVKTMADELKKRIPATIGEEITKTVQKHISDW